MSAPESLSGALIARLRIAPRALGDAITITRWVIERPGLRPRTIELYLLPQVLAATGLLDGRDATSHWSGLGALRKQHPEVKWVAGQRFVQEGPSRPRPASPPESRERCT